MSSEASPGPSAAEIAEQILQRIYGDDFTGCHIDPAEVAAIVQSGFKSRQQRTTDLLELYEKVVEAIDLLSTPPETDKVTDAAELGNILSERLDAIRTVTIKTRETVAKFKNSSAQESGTEHQ